MFLDFLVYFLPRACERERESERKRELLGDLLVKIAG